MCKMIPGQEPYTSEENEALRSLIEGALEAEEYFSPDELEEGINRG